jgi:hypothetical protein
MSAPLQPLIQSRILSLRNQRVMLDADLAQLYGVETRAVVQAVKRNAQRFPADFMFQLDADEWGSLRSQTVISNAAGVGVGRGGRRTAPYAFTEQGVAMLSSVLSSERAVAVNIEIMRTFVRVRELAATHQDLAKRLAELEMKTEGLELTHDAFSRNTRNQLKQVFDAIRELMAPPEPPKRPIGFVTQEDEPSKPTGSKAKTTGKKA